MNNLRWAAIAIMVAGESAMIASEVQASLKGVNPLTVAFQLLAAVMLLVAYKVGYAAWGDIWIVSITSVLTIVFAEPVIVWTMSREVPSTGVAVAFAFALASLVSLTVSHEH